jgi:hypothetical protein
MEIVEEAGWHVVRPYRYREALPCCLRNSQACLRLLTFRCVVGRDTEPPDQAGEGEALPYQRHEDDAEDKEQDKIAIGKWVKEIPDSARTMGWSCRPIRIKARPLITKLPSSHGSIWLGMKPSMIPPITSRMGYGIAILLASGIRAATAARRPRTSAIVYIGISLGPASRGNVNPSMIEYEG